MGNNLFSYFTGIFSNAISIKFHAAVKSYRRARVGTITFSSFTCFPVTCFCPLTLFTFACSCPLALFTSLFVQLLAGNVRVNDQIVGIDIKCTDTDGCPQCDIALLILVIPSARAKESVDQVIKEIPSITALAKRFISRNLGK